MTEAKRNARACIAKTLSKEFPPIPQQGYSNIPLQQLGCYRSRSNWWARPEAWRNRRVCARR